MTKHSHLLFWWQTGYYKQQVCPRTLLFRMKFTLFKASQMGHFVIVSLWCASTNTTFRFLYWKIVKRIYDIVTRHIKTGPLSVEW